MGVLMTPSNREVLPDVALSVQLSVRRDASFPSELHVNTPTLV